jgi:phosphatidylserine/phosphatidylglycerophosphate/cardiolipin synthase-like enzyme
MARTFSLPSNGLGYFIGYLLQDSDRVAFVSPWMSDVEVTVPVTREVEDRSLNLTKAIKRVEKDTSVSVMIKSGEGKHNNYFTSRLPEGVEVRRVEDLHAKAVVGDEMAYVGSANITKNGFQVNQELCQIIENEYPTVDEYVESEIDYL